MTEARSLRVLGEGGDLSEELGRFKPRVKTWNISDLFEETFFETKKIIYLPL